MQIISSPTEEIIAAIRADPDLTCKNIREAVYVVRDGDTSCFKGDPRWSYSVEVNGIRYDIFIGGHSSSSHL